MVPVHVLYYSEVLPTTALILCRCYQADALQAIVSEELAQAPYVKARVGFEPMTFQTQGTEPSTEPPFPIYIYVEQK